MQVNVQAKNLMGFVFLKYLKSEAFLNNVDVLYMHMWFVTLNVM